MKKLLQYRFDIINSLFFLITSLIVLKRYASIFQFEKITSLIFLLTFTLLVFSTLINKINKIEILLILLSALTYLFTRSSEFLIMILYLIASKNINQNNYITFLFFISFFSFIVIIALNYINLVPSQTIHYRLIDNIKINRDDLGFGNPNSAFVYLIPIITSYIYLRYEKWCVLDTILYSCTIYAIYTITLSRTGLLINISSIVLIFLYKKTKISNILNFSIKYSPIFLILLSLIVSILLHDSKTLNSILSNRPYIWGDYINNSFNIQSILGQPLPPHESRLPLDNSYIPLVVYKGIFHFLFFIFLFIFGLKNTTDKKIYTLSFYILLYSMFENTLPNLEFNPVLVLLYRNITPNERNLT